MACYFNANGDLIMRRGDSAKFTIESDNIPFENYTTAYFSVIDLKTLQPVLPELYVATTAERKVEFKYSKQDTKSLPQPTEPYDIYGYTFKLCGSGGIEDTFIPEAVDCCNTNNIIIKKIPRVLFYPEVIEGDVDNSIEE